MAGINFHMIGGWAYPASAMEPLKQHLQPLGAVKTYAFNVPVEQLPSGRGSWWLAGWSLGGMRALQAVAEKKLKPAGLVLISSTLRFCRDGSYEAGVERVALRVMMHGLKPKRKQVLENFFQQSMSPDDSRREQITNRVALAASFTDEDLLAGLAQLDELDLRKAIDALDIPVLILHGGEDRIIPPSAAQYMAGKIRNAHLEIIDGAGHELAIHHAEALAEHIASAVK